ncbi:MAG: alcohol dehydrogenase catalytic domain-containing protein [Microbacterium sp.]
MRAVVYDRIGGEPEVRDVPAARAPDGGVVIDVRATGLCRSDWHAWVGHDDIALPHVPGHEFAGTVRALGRGVTRWRVGDRVTAPFVEGCGACEWCLDGHAQVCPSQQQPGFTHAGSFAEQVVIHAADTNLVRLPAGVSFEAAASLGCRFATAYRALVGRAAVKEGEWVTIVGAGGVGLSATMIALALGARVVCVDRNREALAVASRLGAEHVLSADGDAAAAIQDLTGGAHVSIDAVGSEQTAATAIRSLRRLGRHAQVGLLASDPRLPMVRVIAWELTLLGSHGMAARDYPPMLALIESGALRPAELIERVVSLDEAARLLPVFDTLPVAGMTLIDPLAGA